MGLLELLGFKKEPSIIKPAVIILPRSGHRRNRVQPDHSPLYQQKGWAKNHKSLCGYYHTPYGSWAGSIRKRGDKLLVYIVDPPKAKLKKHPKWSCFDKIDKNIYKLHLHKQPKDFDVSSVISYVEKIIEDSHQKY